MFILFIWKPYRIPIVDICTYVYTVYINRCWLNNQFYYFLMHYENKRIYFLKTVFIYCFAGNSTNTYVPNSEINLRDPNYTIE